MTNKDKKAQIKTAHEACLDLLVIFDDYNNPIEMTAEYVREQIIGYMDRVLVERVGLED